MTKTLYFDESGWTGFDFLNADQPVFVVSSCDIPEDAASEILRASFPRYQGVEFKFSNLWRSPRNRPGFAPFAEAIGPYEGHIFSWVTMKRFAVVTKIVDFLIEPIMSEAGFDFYAQGYCWKLANLIHFDLARLCPPASYDTLLLGYQKLSRQPSRESLVAFQDTLAHLDTGGSETVEAIFGNIKAGADRFERYHRFHEFAGSDELHVSTVMASIGWWRRHFEDDFEIVHDASANFFRRKALWERIGNDGQPPEIQVAGDGTEVEFPLRVIATNQVDSKNSPSVQLCDLIAGLVARDMNPNLGQEDRLFLDQLIEYGLGRLDWNGVRPQEVFPERHLPIRRDGPDVIDQLASRIYGHLPNPN